MAWTITHTDDPYVLFAGLVRRDGTIAWDNRRLGDFQLVDVRALPQRLRILATETIGSEVSLVVVEVAADGTVRRTPFAEPVVDPSSLAMARLAADGSVVALWWESRTAEGRPTRMTVQRFTADLATDAEFGTGGKVDVSSFASIECSDGSLAVVAVLWALVDDGPVIWHECPRVAEIFRLTANGTPDPQWSDGTLSATDLPVQGTIGSVHVDEDGSILVGVACHSHLGDECSSDARPVLVRFEPDGSLDKGWGVDGVATPLVTPEGVVFATTGVMVRGGYTDGSLRVHRLVGTSSS